MDYSFRLDRSLFIPVIDKNGIISVVDEGEIEFEDTPLAEPTADYELAAEIAKAWKIVAANANDFLLGRVFLDNAPIGATMLHTSPANV
jgi:hypothetical protein